MIGFIVVTKYLNHQLLSWCTRI